jgi:hypothetical protein
MKKIQLVLLALLFVAGATAQDAVYWNAYSGPTSIPTDKGVARLSFPKTYKLFSVNIEPLRQQLMSITGERPASRSTIINLPAADGRIEQFEVYEASNFEPALQARFPEIRAYSGRGITDRYSTLKLSLSPQGVQTMVFRTDRENEFIEPYSKDHSVYAVFKSQRQPGQLPWSCSTVDRRTADEINQQVTEAGFTGRSGGDLKTMRLAQSCNAEYSNYFGATSASQVSLVLAAFNNTLTRCNGVYEKDLALHLNLISNTTSVIYYTASSDPYSTNLSSWNASLQSTLTSVIGEANYDIGHMFGSTGGGGNAGCIGCVCVNGSKGSGITSPADGIPQGDNFDIDYVAHEVGHQLGANHTFSMSNEGTGVNKEVGSGITVMGYAGITSQDVANHSIDIFHQASIAQIQTNLATKTCPITTSLAGSNATPVVAAVSNYTIPISTPFALTGSATDADGDALTYCWEQNDNASSTQTGASSVASATKASGPTWITFPASSSPTRTFPRLSTILAGSNITGPLTGGDAGANCEALSSVARTLNFRLTVRDNAPYVSTAPVKVAQTQFTDMVVTVSATSGPFTVTAPNTAVSYPGNSTQTITWSVANTTATPVSCANVKISLSTDGGNTFPTVLASSTPNDGSEALVIPNIPSTTARIKVEAVGNIFFDISNANFTISGPVLCGDPTGLTTTAIGNNSATLNWNAVSGALSYAVDFKLNTATTWTSLSTAQTTTTANLTGLTQGSAYNWRVRATCSGGSGNFVTANFTTTAPFVCTAPTGLNATAITATSATVNWTAVTGAVSYAVDYKASSSTTWISVATATTSTSANITGLAASTLYDYRVSTNCGTNGASGFTAAQFTTASACASAFEPNETTATAATITSGVTNTAAISSATDNDYFRIVTTATSNIVYSLVGPTGVDYDLTIFNSAGTQIGSAATSSSTETVTLNNQVAGTYFIRVFGFSGAFSSTCYTIRATATTVTSCRSTLDNTTNNATSGAATIPFNTDVRGQVETGGDVDHYRFVITTGGTITLTLTTLPANYNLRLVNSAGTILNTSQNSGTRNETISRSITPGTYFVRVYGTNNSTFNATSCYTVRVQLGTASRAGDEFVSLEKGNPSLEAYPNPVQNLLNVSLTGVEGISELRLFDMNGRPLQSKIINQPVAQLNLNGLPRGVYMIKAFNKGACIATRKIIKQ